jgi:transcriptional regulator with XRE-family HTH domain
MTRNELLSHKEYWLVGIQLDLYAQLEAYMKENGMNRTQLAEKLGVTKGYISQVLNGDFDHKISKLVELSLAIGLVPTISYKTLNDVLADDEKAVLARETERDFVHA